MIAPNMATMLGFIVTDAAAHARSGADAAARQRRADLQPDRRRWRHQHQRLGFPAGERRERHHASRRNSRISSRKRWTAVCRKLAQDIVRDGEGATKFITLHVTGAASDDLAHQIANAIGTSPLVKTAFYGGDANWGRIVAAAGRSGVDVDPLKLKLWYAADDDVRGLAVVR